MERFWVCLVFLFILTEVSSLQCHKCPPHEHLSAKACLAGPPEECPSHDTGCFFEYDKMDIRLGCGRDWAQPSGCYGTVCITWCYGDLCNKDLLRQAPFETDLDDLPKTDSPGILPYDWLDTLFGAASSTKCSNRVTILFIIVSVIATMFLC
ncbi:uncharacterized protein LOC116297080 [Actinia tenebrosa]|uniref:Uncharacterized protein LOC116297080 n=1 Tax=Actinia tenebrosa TaxID=6105 RepID=A0A6P8HXI8_ACTTE|nr:uncharacterized protein LOC116297080 [Actinia tenebrosa]